VKVKRLNDECGAWNEYVQKNEKSTFFHQIGWKNVVEKTFGHKPYYLFVENSIGICGILPLFSVKSRLFGKSLISVPYAVYGGICADDEESENLLIEAAIKLAGEENVKYLELRNIDRCNHNLPHNDVYVTFRCKVPAAIEDCLISLPPKARSNVRKAIRHGLELEMGIDKLDEFYNLYAITMKDLGTPVYPFSLITNIVDEFQDNIKIFNVKLDKKTVSCGMAFTFKDTVMGYYGGWLKEYRSYFVNNFLYLKNMEYAVENGYKFMDYGRSRKGTGIYHFKRHWGVEPQDLYYQYYLHGLKEIPQANQSNPKFDLPKKIWQKLPVSVTKWMGPKITKSTP